MLNLAKNYFELFDLPIGFAVDAGLLSERYRALVRSLDSDALIDQQQGQESESAHRWGFVEEAYRTLIDPLARALYLCRLYSEDGEGPSPSNESRPDAGASLMEEMERRETLVSATNRSDPAAAVAKVLTQLAEQSAALDKELHILFADPSPQNLDAVRGVVRQLQFLGRCRRDVEDRRAELGIRD